MPKVWCKLQSQNDCRENTQSIFIVFSMYIRFLINKFETNTGNKD